MGEYLHFPEGHHLYKGTVFSVEFSDVALESVKDFQFREDDTLMIAYPKSGSTWVEETVDLICNGVDLEKSRATSIDKRVGFLELQIPGMSPCTEMLKDRESPRLLRTHLPPDFYPNLTISPVLPKMVVIMRNPKDQLVSYYHFYRMNATFGKFKGTWDTFFEIFKRKHLIYGDYFDVVLGWWQLKEKLGDNVIYLKYEDLKRDPKTEARRLAEFLGKELTEEQLEIVVKATDFKEMKEKSNLHKDHKGMDETISPFMRKGCIGDWKNYFSKEQSEYVDQLCNQKLTSAGLTFDWE